MTGLTQEPIRQTIRPDKQSAKRHYGSHPYFTKRAWNVVQRYIQHFSRPGDLVLDPFGGSGVTAVESLVLRRKAYYLDISEWACFLARQAAIAPADLGGLSAAFGELEERCRRPIEELWKRSNEELASVPVANWYPRGVPLPDNSDVAFVEDLFTPRMLHGLAMLRAGIAETQDPATRDLLLLAFSSTLARINRTFLSATNRQETRGGSAIFSIYRYKVAKQPVELPLWAQFAQRFERLMRAKHETNLLIGDYYRDDETAFFRHGSATRLAECVESESVDYIHTDPPYGAHISYLDLSTMWCAWLRLDISKTDRCDEVIEGGQGRKTREEYQSLLAQSIRQMAEALRRGGWISLVFAHRDTTYWETLVQACEDAGLRYANTVVQPVGVVWSMHEKRNPLRVLSGELVLNFQKVPKRKATEARRKPCSPTELVAGCCVREIVRNFGATTEELHHILVPALLEAGLLREFSKEHGDIAPLLSELFEFHAASGRWHLRDSPLPGSGVMPEELTHYFVRRFLAEIANPVSSVEDALKYLNALAAEPYLLPPRERKKAVATWMTSVTAVVAEPTAGYQNEMFRR